jgi:hypothetical protein
MGCGVGDPPNAKTKKQKKKKKKKRQRAVLTRGDCTNLDLFNVSNLGPIPRGIILVYLSTRVSCSFVRIGSPAPSPPSECVQPPSKPRGRATLACG